MLPDGWKRVELSHLVSFKSGGTPPKDNDAYWNGDIPWVSAKDMKSFELSNSILKVTSAGAKNGTRLVPANTLLILVRGMTLKKDVPICLTTREVAFNQDLKALLTQPGVNPYFLAYFLVSRKQQLMALVNEAGHGTGRLQTDLLEEFPVLIPPPAEQKTIVAQLRTWDRAIRLLQKLIADKQLRRKALMRQLLTGRFRFNRFSEPWATVRLGDVFHERLETSRADLPLLSITTGEGVILRDGVGRKDTSSENKGAYLHISPGDIGYNTMRMWQGVSGLSRLEGIVSPAYTVITPDSSIDAEFMAVLFKYQPVVHLFWRYSQGMVDDTLNLKFTNFAKIKVTIPEKEEQKAIATVFRLVDREIAILREELAAQQEQKKGLMQQLLAGKRRANVSSAA